MFQHSTQMFHDRPLLLMYPTVYDLDRCKEISFISVTNNLPYILQVRNPNPILNLNHNSNPIFNLNSNTSPNPCGGIGLVVTLLKSAEVNDARLINWNDVNYGTGLNSVYNLFYRSGHTQLKSPRQWAQHSIHVQPKKKKTLKRFPSIECLFTVIIISSAVLVIVQQKKLMTRFNAKRNPKNFHQQQQQQQQHCQHLHNASKQFILAAERPPWFDLQDEINSTVWNSMTIRRVFYLTAEMPYITRLGNRMFLYGALFGIAWRNKGRIPLWNDTRLVLRTIFTGLRIAEDQNNQHRNVEFTTIKVRNTTTSKFTEANFFDSLPLTDVRLEGYFLNSKYLGNAESQLRYDFTFSPDVIRQAQSMLDAFGASSFCEQGYVRVVMHVRRTVYSQRTDDLLQQQPAFFERSMAYFTDCLPKVHFIVISDDISWCRKKIFGHNVDFIEGERSPAVDLAIASLCDHAIVTVGTFGWWAAWFANGVTLRPRSVSL